MRERWIRWRVLGRNHFGAHEIGIFWAVTRPAALAKARRQCADVIGGLQLEAHAT